MYVYVVKKTEEIFTALGNRQDTYCPMQNFMRSPMELSVFPSTVHKSLYSPTDNTFRAAVMYGVTRKLTGVSVCFEKIRKNIHNSCEQTRHTLSDAEFHGESNGVFGFSVYRAQKFVQHN